MTGSLKKSWAQETKSCRSADDRDAVNHARQTRIAADQDKPKQKFLLAISVRRTRLRDRKWHLACGLQVPDVEVAIVYNVFMGSQWKEPSLKLFQSVGVS